jgi:hypothetical protein
MSVRLDGRAVDSIALGPAWRSCTAAGTRNVVALDSEAVASFAEETVLYLRQLEKHFGVSIRRIAIDAPSEPRADRLTRRLAETALDQRQISCFATPSAAEFEIIRGKVRDRLGEGGLESRLPHANQLWMLVGCALFQRLQYEWDCLEVYPQISIQMIDANLRLVIHPLLRASASALATILSNLRPRAGPPASGGWQKSAVREGWTPSTSSAPRRKVPPHRAAR